MPKLNLIATDLAKSSLQVCHISKEGELLFNKAFSRNKFKELLATSKPSIVAMEGCGSSHYWGRLALRYGHDVRIINPKKVKSYLEGHKTDANDALAIANATMSIGLKFGKPKTEQQQIIQSLESSKAFLLKTSISQSNHIRALLYEYGVIGNKGSAGLRRLVADVVESASEFPDSLLTMLQLLWTQYLATESGLKSIKKHIKSIISDIQPCNELMNLEGVGDVCAGLIYAVIGNGSQFKNGREASAFIGLTPKQHSSGGKVIMKGIDKAGGIKPLRAALYMGSLSFINQLPDEPKTVKHQWLKALITRVGVKRACIALANKTIRTAWALLRYNKPYQLEILPA